MISIVLSNLRIINLCKPVCFDEAHRSLKPKILAQVAGPENYLRIKSWQKYSSKLCSIIYERARCELYVAVFFVCIEDASRLLWIDIGEVGICYVNVAVFIWIYIE